MFKTKPKLPLLQREFLKQSNKSELECPSDETNYSDASETLEVNNE